MLLCTRVLTRSFKRKHVYPLYEHMRTLYVALLVSHQ